MSEWNTAALVLPLAFPLALTACDAKASWPQGCSRGLTNQDWTFFLEERVTRAVYTSRSKDAFCRLALVSVQLQPHEVIVRELSSSGAVVRVQAKKVGLNEYIDATLSLGEGEQLNLFAHAVKVLRNQNTDEVHLRWMHFDPGEEDKLDNALLTVLGPNPNVAKVLQASTPEPSAQVPEKTTGSVAKDISAKDSAAVGTSRQVAKPRAGVTQPKTQEPAKVGSEGRWKREDVSDAVKEKGQAIAIVPTKRYEELDTKKHRVTTPSAKPSTSQVPPTTSTSIPEPQELDDGTLDFEDPKTAVRIALEQGTARIQRERGKDGKDDTHVKNRRGVVRPQAASAESALDSIAAPLPKDSSDDEIPAPIKSETAVRIERKKEFFSESAPEHPAAEAPKKVAAPPLPIKTIKPETTRIEKDSDKNLDEVDKRILSRTRTVVASELAARHDVVRVLNMSTIKKLINDCVDEAIGNLDPLALNRDALLGEIEKQVKARMQSASDQSRDWEAKARGLERQLEAAQKTLENERKREIEAKTFTVSESGLDDLDRRFNRLLTQAIKGNGVSGPLADELQGMVSRLLDSEREKIAERALAEHNEKMEILERKIERLAKNLASTEADRDRHVRLLRVIEGHAPGQANIYEVGLVEDDPRFQSKKALLKEVFEQNQAMRDQYLQKYGKELTTARKDRIEAQKRAEEAAAKAAADAATAPQTAAGVKPEAAVLEAPVASKTEEPPAESEVSTGESEPPMDDPDDLPWQGPAQTEAQRAAQEDARSVHILTNYKEFDPPPLTVTDVVDDDAAVVAVSDADPDDLPWEGPVADTVDEERSVKIITATGEAPPLNTKDS